MLVQVELLLLADVNVCLEKEMLLPLFDALPEMLVAVYEHLIVLVALSLTVAVKVIGLDLLCPLTFTGLPLAELTEDL